MNFSISNSALVHEFPSSEDMDIFCFFSVKNSIYLPISSFKNGILASLKQKKEVLLLTEIGIPNTISRNLQWDGGDHWLWLPPRSASIVSGAWKNSDLESASLVQLISKLNLLK